MFLDKNHNDKKGEITMPKGERKQYTKEFKLSAVYLMLSKTYKPKEVFNMLQVDRQTVYRWIKEFKENGEKAFEDRSVLPGDELKRLQKQNKDLQMENEILKKATAYFANRNRRG